MSEHTPETLEDALALIQALQKKADAVESEATKLKATNQGLLKDLKKKKTIDSFLKVAGIELTEDLDEESIAERIASVSKARSQSQEPLQQQSPATRL